MKQEHELTRRFAALSLAAVLPAAMLGGCGAGDKKSDTGLPAGKTHNTPADKTESVFAKADAAGRVRETTVSVTLRNPGGTDAVTDVTTLKDIRNTEGDETFTRGADGLISWQNFGRDIEYEGTTEAELPVSVRISYTLNGTPIEPEELAGQSGHVTIRFDYTNNADTSVPLNGRETAVKTPFAAATVLLLPEEHFSNIETENGKLIPVDGDTLVLGTVLPELAEQLSLDGYEITQDIELPDYFEISADADEFALDFTATVLTAELFSDLDPDDLQDADDLADSMEELTDASAEVLDGIRALREGAGTYGGYLNEYMDAVNALKEGAEALNEGMKTLNGSKTALAQGADALRDGLGQLDAALSGLSSATGESAMGGAPQLLQGILTDAAVLQASLTALQPGLAGMATAETAAAQGAQAAADLQLQMQQLAALLQELSAMTGQLEQLQTGVGQLYEGSRQLSDGVGTFNDGIAQLADGTAALTDGAAQLAQAGGELADGYDELIDGVKELEDGYRKFDEEGIRELSDLAGEDLREVITRLRALKAAGDAYTNFSGLQEGQSGSVRFLIETDEIKAD